MKRKARRNVVVVILVVAIATATWFLGVHRLQFIEYYPKTESMHRVVEHRVFGIRVHKDVLDGDSFVAFVARDLGITGLENEREYDLWQRYWGLWICAAPCYQGTVSMTGGVDTNYERYERDMRPGVHALLDREPNVAEEFEDRMIDEKDMDYWRDLCARCEQLSKEDQKD